MAETPTTTGGSALGNIFGGVLRSDVAFALGMLLILSFMLVPMPPFALDMGLSLSVTFSVLIMMTVMFINRPLELSSFPTILLVVTALRLGLNVASTRLILSNGHEGDGAAGSIISAFGSFIIQDNYVVGGIVFAILIIVNFVVITKGSGRIAEVAARFTLDAMPGKQMAIDSDLSAGLITEDEAKTRRKELEQESTFFGAMDGAAKFVRGDAIAGLLITVVNVIGGIIIGAGMKGLTLADAASTYTLLTIGDGLVSQIPALMVSVSAGLLVSKAGVDGTADKVLLAQFAKYPKAIAMSSFMLFVLAISPGIPFVPFFILSVAAGGLSYLAYAAEQKATAQQVELKALEAKQQGQLPGGEAKPAEEPISQTLAMDIIRIELGYNLLALVQGENKLTDQIKGLRRQFAEDMGYILPSVRIQDNLQLPSNSYVVRIKEVESGRGEVRPTMFMIMDPSGDPISLPGENTVEPTFGLPAMWIDEKYQEEAHFKGYTVVDAATVISTHITEIVRDNMSDLLSYAETQKLLDELPEQYQKLVTDVIPSQISVGALQRILQNLVSERVSIRDLPTILEGVAEASGITRNVSMITEHVRSRLARHICDRNTSHNGYMPLVSLSPNWEQAFSESLVGNGDEVQLAMAPTRMQEFIAAVRDKFDTLNAQGEMPVLLTSPGIRPFVRSVIERFRPHTVVVSQNEIHPRAKIKTVGQI
ncbi:MAG: flagellar biosynthesis protein FlhA [Pseudomonadota bacterium]|nr:flagellar biosynthesis protein FlhA [Alphaproteobacteria bacterium]MEC7701553.1 flagellar biosynthesis protein FlhA [Pseudomonadota bacterium]MEC9235595.1 flagellar biosynthesis protein FlhA [Pseudomonadota bacterium]|tara:strand:- start:304725 stop:306842 length:2118 start_codon:yes stop_codon:yes gene_type:complete